MREIKIYRNDELQAGTLYRQNYGNPMRDNLYKWVGTEGNVIYDIGLIKRKTSIILSVYLAGLGDNEFIIPDTKYKVLKE